MLEAVALETTVLRDARQTEIPVDELVPGDVVLLSAGSGISADCRLLAEQDLFVDEAALTGESWPVDKSPGVVPADAPLAQRDNVLFLGTHVVSGSRRVVVVRTGRVTEFGKISERLRLRPQETEFAQGVRRFGYLLLEVTLVRCPRVATGSSPPGVGSPPGGIPGLARDDGLDRVESVAGRA